MKIRTRISLITILVAFTAVFISTSIAIFDIKAKGKEDFARYRKDELSRIKQNLKNFVDVAYETIDSSYKNTQNQAFLEKFYGKRLRSVIDIAESILKQKAELVKQGALSFDEAKKQAFDAIRKIRYDDGTGYVWINDTKLPYPRMVMHPIIPSLEGKVLDDPKYNCVRGTNQNLFQAFVQVCNKTNEGYVQYLWPKPTKTSVILSVPKLSYVRVFKDWSLIIGTGIYIDDAIVDAKNNAKQQVKNMRYDNGVGYFWINDTGRPYPKMVMHPTVTDLDGKVLDDSKYDCVQGTNQNLFQAFVDVCRKQGEGFVEYIWPKPTKTGVMPDVPKMSYGRMFKAWDWIIGTGVYIDSIEVNIAKEQKIINNQVNSLILKILISALIVLILAIFLSLFCANTMATPIKQLIKTMRKVKQQGLISAEVSPKGSAETKELGYIFNEMLVSINESAKKLQETTAAKERIESELNIARDIQMSIVPHTFPPYPDRNDIDLFAVLNSAKAVGGDLYDFFFLEEDKLCLVVGDVSGKGVPASLFMAVTRTLLRSKSVAGLSAGEIVTQVNKDLCIDNDMCMFVTFFMCIFDFKTGKLDFCNAGHNPAYIVRKSGKIERLETLHGTPLGLFDEAPYGSDEVSFSLGDKIVCYTDGVTEALNTKEELFGDERLEEVLNKTSKELARSTTENIVGEVEKFSVNAEQADDITILVFEYLS